MSWEAIGAAVGAVAGLAGAVVAIWRARIDARTGVSSDERAARREEAEDRRDTIADRDSLLKTVIEESRQLREEVRGLRSRVEHLEQVARNRADHIDVLEHHIWSGKGRPPPRRPEGV